MSGRIRSIKPEWLEDEALLCCSSDARVLSVALVLLADDYGNGRGADFFLAAQVFPGKELRLTRDALAELQSMRFVLMYQADGQTYFSIRNWAKHQKVDKPGRPRVPGPELNDDSDRPVVRIKTAYFIRASTTGLIKIGESIDPINRLTELAATSPEASLELLAVGGNERNLHAEFAAYRVHGEWFRPDAKILAKIIEFGGNISSPLATAGYDGSRRFLDKLPVNLATDPDPIRPRSDPDPTPTPTTYPDHDHITKSTKRKTRTLSAPALQPDYSEAVALWFGAYENRYKAKPVWSAVYGRQLQGILGKSNIAELRRLIPAFFAWKRPEVIRGGHSLSTGFASFAMKIDELRADLLDPERRAFAAQVLEREKLTDSLAVADDSITRINALMRREDELERREQESLEHTAPANPRAIEQGNTAAVGQLRQQDSGHHQAVLVPATRVVRERYGAMVSAGAVLRGRQAPEHPSGKGTVAVSSGAPDDAAATRIDRRPEETK